MGEGYSIGGLKRGNKNDFRIGAGSPKRFVIARLTRVHASLISAKLEEKLGRLMKTDCRTATRA